jgi:lambda family phage portal protein
MWSRHDEDKLEGAGANAMQEIGVLRSRNKAAMRMNIIDKAISYINPKAGFERARYRASLSFFETAYQGASLTDRKVRGYFPFFSRNPDEEVLRERPALVARCRDEYRNNPIARAAVNTPVISVIGTGLAMQCRIDREFLELSDTEASQWESNAERLFASWASHVDADAARKETFYGLQQLMYRSYRLSGEAFALLPIIPRAGTISDLRVQVVEADLVSTPTDQVDFGDLHSGIETGNYAEPIAYYVETTPPQPYTAAPRTWARIPAFGEKTGRCNVVHLFSQDRPGQRRGVPSLTPIIGCLKKLGDYTDNELLATVVSSMFTVFIKSDTSKLAGEITQGAVEPSMKPSSKEPPPVRMGPGAIVDLAPDEDVAFANPGRPSAQFDPFVQAILRQVGMALNIPYEVLVKHFSASYSASRAALMQAWEFYKNEREMFIAKFCQPVYEEWLWDMALAGKIDAPGFFDSVEIRRAYCEARWHGPVPLQIDPQKEAGAAQQRLNANLSTVAEETAMLTGNDYEANFYQRAKEIKLAETLGLNVNVVADEKITDAVSGPPKGENEGEMEDESSGDDESAGRGENKNAGE